MNGKKARSAASFFIGAILVCAPAFAQGPSADWRTITTAHFRIHYPAQYEAWFVSTAHTEAEIRRTARVAGESLDVAFA